LEKVASGMDARASGFDVLGKCQLGFRRSLFGVFLLFESFEL
jgi:hypothetical protein